VQSAQERQTRRGLPLEQNQDEWKTGELYPLFECLVIFSFLPIADAFLAHQKNEGVRSRDLLGQLL